MLSASAAAAYGMRRVRRFIGAYSARAIVRTWVRMLLASAGAGYVAWGVVIILTRALAGFGRVGYAVILLVGGMIFAVVYLLVARLLRVEEIAVIAAPVLNRLDRRPPGRHPVSYTHLTLPTSALA